MTNVQHLRPQPAFSSWGGRPGAYYAEADRAERNVGLCIEKIGRKWRFEVVTAADDVLCSGDVRTLRDAKSVLAAAATRLIG